MTRANTRYFAWGVAIVLMASVFETQAKPAFFLPERLYAAPGLEVNVYYKDVFDSVVPERYAFQAASKKGRAERTRWCWIPTEADAGTSVPLVINAWDDDGIVAAVTTTVEVAAAPTDRKRPLTLALFADSGTNCRFQDRIRDDMHAAGFAGYRPIGSRKAAHSGGVPHDGFGGYTCRTFLTHYSVSEEEIAHVQDAAEREQLLALGVPTKIVHDWQRGLLRSPLVQFRNGKKELDIPAWLQTVNDGVPPDVVLIELGVNDVFSYTGEMAELRARIRREVIPSFDRFVDVLKPFMPKARFALTTQPNGCSQDGFGVNYGSGWNEVQHRKIVFALNRELADFAARRQIDLVPVANAVDPFYGFLHAKVKACAVSDELVVRDSNAVHCSEEGGRQMGNAISAWLQCRWNEFGSK